MTIAAAILFSDAPSTQFLVGGLPLWVRHIKELRKLEVKEHYLLGIAEVPRSPLNSRLPDDVVLHTVSCSAEDIPYQLRTLPGSPQELLLLRGDWLIDPRLLAALLGKHHPQWLPAPTAKAAALPIAARLSSTSLDIWATAGLQQWLQSDPVLESATLDTYSASHRGHKPFYLRAITTPEDAVTATKTLIEAAQKQALDLPALLLHPFFENRLVFWLCNSRITPNQITLFTAVLGVLIAIMFLNGWLGLGILLASVVAILDGVDGKLARTRLQTSRLGEVEHVLDFFVEHAWYLTITIFLAVSTRNKTFWWVGGGLMGCDLVDNFLYILGRALLGKQLDELGSFDRTFRLIGGRRNIYIWMFLVGFWGGFPSQALVVACGWALTTVGVHSIRLVHHIRRRGAVA